MEAGFYEEQGLKDSYSLSLSGHANDYLPNGTCLLSVSIPATNPIKFIIKSAAFVIRVFL